METVAGSADLTMATVLAARGEHDQVGPLLARVLAAVDVAEYLGFAARIRHATGLAALAQGNHVAAYAQLSQLFAADGTPLHHHFSYLAIADLAAAAARGAPPRRRVLVGRAPSSASASPIACSLSAAGITAWGRAIAARLAAATQAAASTAGWTYVSASAASAGHHAWSAAPWTRRFHLSLRGGAPYHPNAAGMAAVAELVLATLAEDR